MLVVVRCRISLDIKKNKQGKELCRGNTQNLLLCTLQANMERKFYLQVQKDAKQFIFICCSVAIRVLIFVHYLPKCYFICNLKALENQKYTTKCMLPEFLLKAKIKTCVLTDNKIYCYGEVYCFFNCLSDRVLGKLSIFSSSFVVYILFALYLL